MTSGGRWPAFGIIICALTMAAWATPLSATTHGALFDVAKRRAELASPAFESVRNFCLEIDMDDELGLAPIKGLKETKGYGSDQSAEDFSWAVMTLAGRAIAGDRDAEQDLSSLLHSWARADAFDDTDDSSDGLFSLKRVLLPVIVGYSVVQQDMGENERRTVFTWIDGLTRHIDRVQDGDVDLNNHRYLADAVLTTWGMVTGSPYLLERGRLRLKKALLEQMRSDGSFPLEARRGSRAIWYHRQSLSSLTTILAALETAGDEPLADPALAEAWDRSLTFLLGTIERPEKVFRYAAENYRPGPESDYEKQDLTFLDRRGHGRHYMAWAERAVHFRPDSEPSRRLKALIAQEAAKERPLIDEFVGGAATCFWSPPA